MRAFTVRRNISISQDQRFDLQRDHGNLDLYSSRKRKLPQIHSFLHQAELVTGYLARFAETALALVGAGAGPSGWHTPVVPPSTPI